MEKISRRTFIRQACGVAGALVVGKGLTDPPEAFAQKGGETTVPDISVVTGRKPDIIVREAVRMLGGMGRFVSKGDVVVVKPNIAWDRSPQQAANTNPWVVAEVVKMCFEAGASKVKVFDRTCHNPKRAYENSRIAKAAKDAGAEVSHTLAAGFVEVKFPHGVALKSWWLYKPAIEADVLINVPIVKHHALTEVTLGIKNLMGIMGKDRGDIHKNIHQKIVDVAAFIRPRLTILDAYRVLTANGPQGGSLDDVKVLKTVAAGTSIATMDAWGAELLGHSPKSLPFLVEANARGLGEIDMKKVIVKKVSLPA